MEFNKDTNAAVLLVCIFSYLYTLKSYGSKAVHSNSFTV